MPLRNRADREGLPRHHPARKGADFRLVSYRKITDRTFFRGTRQMTATSVAGAAPGSEVDWHSIDWAKAHQTVRRLQVRIAKAVRDRRWNKVKALQWLLTHSFCGKAMAVKRVTENRGKRTPGVDGETWSTTIGRPNLRRLSKTKRARSSTLPTTTVQ